MTRCTERKAMADCYEHNMVDFCQAMDCTELKNNRRFCTLNQTCSFSAKDFHHWLKENGHRIVRITSGSA